MEENNLPLAELKAAMTVVGPRINNILHLVVTNWSRGYARVTERRQQGVTEQHIASRMGRQMR